MKSFKLACITALLSLLPLSAFATKPATCPSLSTIIENADTMDTVSAIFGKMPPPRLADYPYIVFSLVPLELNRKLWFLITVAMTNTMDEGLIAAAENIKQANLSLLDVPDEEGPVQLCAYRTPQDPSDMASIIAISFPGLMPPNIVSFMKNHVALKAVHHRYSLSIK